MPLAEMVREDADIALSPCFDDFVAVNFVGAALLKAILVEAMAARSVGTGENIAFSTLDETATGHKTEFHSWRTRGKIVWPAPQSIGLRTDGKTRVVSGTSSC